MHKRQRQFKQPRGAARHDDLLDSVARFNPTCEGWLRSICYWLVLLLSATPAFTASHDGFPHPLVIGHRGTHGYLPMLGSEPGTVRAQYVVFLAFHAPPPYLVWNVTPPLGPSSLPQPWGWDQAASDTTPIFFLNAGVHTLTIRQRDSGTKLDKLVITNDVNWMPQE